MLFYLAGIKLALVKVKFTKVALFVFRQMCLFSRVAALARDRNSSVPLVLSNQELMENERMKETDAKIARTQQTGSLAPLIFIMFLYFTTI